MNLPTFGMLVWAELFKLSSRTSFRLALGILALLAVCMPCLCLGIDIVMNQSPQAVEAGVDPEVFHATTVLTWVLNLRNFLLARTLLIALVAVSVAGEFVSRTLREDLVRPVSRTQVISAKLVALQVYVLASVLVPLLICLPLAVLFFGNTGPLLDVGMRWGLTWLGDAGFCTLVVALAVAIRSVPGTLVGVLLYWLVDRAFGMALYGAEAARPMLDALLKGYGMLDAAPAVDTLIAARPWLPSAAFNLEWDFNTAAEIPVAWESLVALVMYTAVAYTVAVVIMRRVDVD